MNEGGNDRFRFLRGTLFAGAAYDTAFGLPVLLAPGLLAPVLGLALPTEQVYLRLNGLFLLILAMFYLAIAADPGGRAALVRIAIVGRTLGGLFFLVYRIGYDGDPVFLWLGLGDLLFAALHAGALRAALRNPRIVP